MRDLHLNPYAGVAWNTVERHLGQFHAHSSSPPTEGHSGSDPPPVVIDNYHDAGYSVLALTGHEYNLAEPTWPWTDWDRDPTKLGMVAVPGVELGGSDGGIEHDLLCYFCDFTDTRGMSIHEALAEIDDRGGLAVFSHPGRYHEDGKWYVEYFRRHASLLGVEVINAADRYPTDRDVWDNLQGRLGTTRAVWGFANDDYHGHDEDYPFDRSRNLLLVEELTQAAVREAMIDGRFFYQYCVDGEPPVIDAIHHDPDAGALVVDARKTGVIQWISDGSVVHRGPRLHYRTAEDIGSFVRARLVGKHGGETGTQPFLFT